MKNMILWIVSAILLMIGGPWLALTFSGMDAMGVCFILFFAVDPLFSAVCGIFSGMDVRKMWWLPLFTAGAFLAGVWIFFEMGEPAFLIYSGGYLAIGVLAMLLTAWIKGKSRK